MFDKPGKLKKLRRFHHNHRIVNKRAEQRRSWYSDGWVPFNDHGTWRIIWVRSQEQTYLWDSLICGKTKGENVMKVYPNSWLKNNNSCGGRRCRCHRKGWYKHPESGRPWGHRKGWNKFKDEEWKFHEDVSNDWITEI